MAWGVVIVNYNSALMAIDAALSALGDEPETRVIIVDNSTRDDDWCFFNKALGASSPHAPIAPQDAAPAPNFALLEACSHQIVQQGEPVGCERLTVVRAASNDGFGAGCNIGLRLLAEDPQIDHFLLLNPDAQLATGALTAFRARLAAPTVGLCGATVMNFHSPTRVETFGGARLSSLSLRARPVGAGERLRDAPAMANVESATDFYPLGAAIAFRRDYYDRIGGIDERFFLYFEEADWVRRGRPAYAPAWARDAVVYHRQGASTERSSTDYLPSPLSEYHMARSRMLFALKWRPYLAPLILAFTLVAAFRKAARGHQDLALAVLKSLTLNRRMT